MSTRAIVDSIKEQAACEACGYSRNIRNLEFHHVDPSTKYRTRTGKAVHPADMIAKGYALDVVLRELEKCRILCRNCHGEETFSQFNRW